MESPSIRSVVLALDLRTASRHRVRFLWHGLQTSSAVGEGMYPTEVAGDGGLAILVRRNLRRQGKSSREVVRGWGSEPMPESVTNVWP